MSSNLPPSGPPSQPPNQPPHEPTQPVWGQPPSGPPPQQPPAAPTQPPPGYQPGSQPGSQPGYPPPSGPPEMLESGAGGPLPPPGYPAPNSGGGRRKAILAGGTVVGVAALAGGAFAVYSVFFAGGPQPAEALPASTIGYVSIDVKPSGEQQIEALDTLNKFPGFKDEVDLGSDDDVRKYVFEMAQGQGACPDVDFDDDIKPWLGDTFGVAAVDLGKKDDEGNAEVTPVVVVQVTDAEKADDGLTKLRDCAAEADGGDVNYDEGSDSDSGTDSGSGGSSAPAESPAAEEGMGGWAIEGDWAVIAETEDLAKEVSEAAQDDPLSDDDSFKKWTDAAGDDGILTAYASPDAGAFLAEEFENSFAVSSDYACAETVPAPTEPGTEPGTEDGDDVPCGDSEGEETDPAAEQVKKLFEDFDGAAVTVRFNDGGLEIESASSVDFGGLGELYGTDRGDDVVATLPDDTAVAVGLGFEDGWFTEITDYASTFTGGMMDIDQALAEIEQETGLALPEDAETLAGESAAFALSGDTDFEAADSDPSAVLGGIKVKGNTGDIEGVIEKLLDNPSVPADFKDTLTYSSDDDYVVAGFNEDYANSLLEDGDLGDSDTYQDVVKESDDAAAVIYVNFDAGGWLDRVVGAEGDEEVTENVEPLKALGYSVWADDDVAHGLLRVTFE